MGLILSIYRFCGGLRIAHGQTQNRTNDDESKLVLLINKKRKGIDQIELLMGVILLMERTSHAACA